jgi:hypothetical protein
VYHFIRGQNVIKLYVLCSMMEIMDKLLRYLLTLTLTHS